VIALRHDALAAYLSWRIRAIVLCEPQKLHHSFRDLSFDYSLAILASKLSAPPTSNQQFTHYTMPSTTITAMGSSFPGSPYVSVRKLGEGSFGQVSWSPRDAYKVFL
jgi:hypothetical protein